MEPMIGFLGGGNMATAVIRGYLPHTQGNILVYDIDRKKVENLEHCGAKGMPSAEALAGASDYLVLAVKPQSFEEVLTELRGHVRRKTVVVSIAAGITAGYIKKMLGFDAKVVTVMPNTPLLLGMGATALAQLPPVTDEEFAFCKGIFASSGITAVVPPERMNEVIPVNGSAPAFIYQITKHFMEYAVENGIDADTALKLFAQTLVGSAHMMTDSGYDIDTLIQMVSSKGGTTIAGLEAFRDNNLGEVIQKGCEACAKRARELSE